MRRGLVVTALMVSAGCSGKIEAPPDPSWTLVSSQTGALFDQEHPERGVYPNPWEWKDLKVSLNKLGELCGEANGERFCGGPLEGIPFTTRLRIVDTTVCLRVTDIYGHEVHDQCGIQTLSGTLEEAAQQGATCYAATNASGDPCVICADETGQVTENSCGPGGSSGAGQGNTQAPSDPALPPAVATNACDSHEAAYRAGFEDMLAEANEGLARMGLGGVLVAKPADFTANIPDENEHNIFRMCEWAIRGPVRSEQSRNYVYGDEAIDECVNDGRCRVAQMLRLATIEACKQLEQCRESSQEQGIIAAGAYILDQICSEEPEFPPPGGGNGGGGTGSNGGNGGSGSGSSGGDGGNNNVGISTNGGGGNGGTTSSNGGTTSNTGGTTSSNGGTTSSNGPCENSTGGGAGGSGSGGSSSDDDTTGSGGSGGSGSGSGGSGSGGSSSNGGGSSAGGPKHALSWDGTGDRPFICRGSPLVIDLAGDGLSLRAPDAEHGFALLDGATIHSGWLSGSDDALLAADFDKNGRIDRGGELFGEGSRGFAADGFEALAYYDDNADGQIDAKDAIFSSLLLWRDNGDAVSSEDELLTLEMAKVQSISLHATKLGTLDAFGNELGLDGQVKLADGRARQVIDVWFRIGKDREQAFAMLDPKSVSCGL